MPASISLKNLKHIKNVDKKYFAAQYAKAFVWKIFRLLLLLGLTFVIIYPFLVKISSAFMSYNDAMDSTVGFIPKNPSLNNFKLVLTYGHYLEGLLNTTLISLTSGLFQMISCTMIGYGFAKFQFKGRKLLMALVILTMLVPPQTIVSSLYMKFRYFDFFGILNALGIPLVSLTDTYWPSFLLSATGLGLKNGLYILVMTQFFRGIPKELTEAAKVDGAKNARIFFSVMLPNARTMMVMIFALAFSWAWTDTFYAGLFYPKMVVLSNIVAMVAYIPTVGIYDFSIMSSVMTSTATLMVILPLLLFFIVAQKQLVQGIERSGMVE